MFRTSLVHPVSFPRRSSINTLQCMDFNDYDDETKDINSKTIQHKHHISFLGPTDEGFDEEELCIRNARNYMMQFQII